MADGVCLFAVWEPQPPCDALRPPTMRKIEKAISMKPMNWRMLQGSPSQ